MVKRSVIKHNKTSKKGKKFKVKKHSRNVKAKAVSHIIQLHPMLSHGDAGHMFDVTIDTIKFGIKTDKKVSIPDFGIFKRKAIPARKGGKKIQAFGKTFISKSKPASVKIKFFPSKKFKKMVM